MNKLILLIFLTYSSVLCGDVCSSQNNQDTFAINYECFKPLILTPYIEKGNIKKAQKLSRVHHLKGSGKLKSYSGFLTVNKTCNSNLFFWFFPSKSDYENSPVTLWLAGGPGQSSLIGLFEEIGPFYVRHNKTKLFLREFSWNKNSSILFIDNPVGAGFSFTDNIECYATNQDDVRKDLYSALVQFFKLFPNLQKNQFFIFGESYAGKYVPGLAYSIHEQNPKSDIKINLIGLGIAGGLCDPVNMMVYSDYLYQIGILDENGKSDLHNIEQHVVELINKKDWYNASIHYVGFLLTKIHEYLAGIDIYNYSKLEESVHPYVGYVKDNTTRKAIHVGNVSYTRQNYKVHAKFTYDFANSVKPWILVLIENYKILFFNGQFDVIVGFPLTRNFLSLLNWSGADEFRRENQKPFYDNSNSNVCGFIKQYKNLRLAVVRNAGHMVPTDQPECAYKLYETFVFSD